MKTATKILSIVIIALASLTGMSQSTEYTLDESNSSMLIKGTSSLHDWEATAEQIDLSVSFNPGLLKQENPEVPVTSLSVNVPVNSIESGKGGMNRKIYGALQEKKHPEIMFNLLSAELADSATPGKSFILNLTGNLNIAGTLREVSFPVTGILQDNGEYQFTGSYELNMKDYNVDPPSALFGTIKSGEVVTIEFDMLLTPTQS